MCAPPPRPTEWKPFEGLLDTQHWTTGWKLHQCQVTGAQGGQEVNPTAPHSTDYHHHPRSDHEAGIPDSSLSALLFTLLGSKCPVLVFSPVFKCSNSRRQTWLLVPFTRHQLQNLQLFLLRIITPCVFSLTFYARKTACHCTSLGVQCDRCLGALQLERNHLQAKINHCHLVSLLIYY